MLISDICQKLNFPFRRSQIQLSGQLVDFVLEFQGCKLWDQFLRQARGFDVGYWRRIGYWRQRADV